MTFSKKLVYLKFPKRVKPKRIFVNANIRNNNGDLICIKGKAILIQEIVSNNMSLIKYKDEYFYVKNKTITKNENITKCSTDNINENSS